ncbi:MAG TPA: hypothetical protein VE153_11085 [Myxococcus sp.]|nr:hypothetical protein [Myxococcus sp.]
MSDMTMKKRFGSLVAFMMWIAAAPAWAVDNFTTTYVGGSGATCGTTYNILGQEPTEAGRYPLFIYTVGTGEAYNTMQARFFVEKMAARGFVAASVQYDNASFSVCSTLTSKAKCIFSASNAKSAVGVLCARGKADCSKGIVVAGLSQGSVMAALAKNYDSRVQAAFGMGLGTLYITYDVSSCVADGRRILPSDRLLAIDGEVDEFLSGTVTGNRTQLQQLTGLSCTSTSFSCFRSNNSGWYMVKGTQLQDGKGDHCYMRNGGCYNTAAPFDATWQSGNEVWSVDTNLSWLSSFALP